MENALAGAPLARRKAARAAVVFGLAYATAFMETLTIAHVRCAFCVTFVCLCVCVFGLACVGPWQRGAPLWHAPRRGPFTQHVTPPAQFPYYTFVDRAKMYRWGGACREKGRGRRRGAALHHGPAPLAATQPSTQERQAC